MGKVFWAVILLFVALCFYVLLSAFGSIGEVDTTSGMVVRTGERKLWLAGTQGFAVVTYNSETCVTAPADQFTFGDIITVRAKVPDSFLMSVCDTADGYVKVRGVVYPPITIDHLIEHGDHH